MNYHIEVEVLSRCVKFLTVIPALVEQAMTAGVYYGGGMAAENRERGESARGDEREGFT